MEVMNFGAFLVWLLVTGVSCLEMEEEQQKRASYTWGGALNDRCRNPKDCRPFGYVCRANRTCQCDQWYIPDQFYEKCVGGVNQKCLYDEHCIEGAYCENQSVCKCKESSPYAFDNGLICASAVQLAVSLPVWWILLTNLMV